MKLAILIFVTLVLILTIAFLYNKKFKISHFGRGRTHVDNELLNEYFRELKRAAFFYHYLGLWLSICFSLIFIAIIISVYFLGIDVISLLSLAFDVILFLHIREVFQRITAFENMVKETIRMIK